MWQNESRNGKTGVKGLSWHPGCGWPHKFDARIGWPRSYAQADPLAALADRGGPLPPRLFSISCSFQAIMTRLGAQGPPEVKTPLAPPDQNPGSAPGQTRWGKYEARFQHFSWRKNKHFTVRFFLLLSLSLAGLFGTAHLDSPQEACPYWIGVRGLGWALGFSRPP